MEAQLEGCQIQRWRLDPLHAHIDAKQVLCKFLDQHLVKFGATANERADHTGGVQVFQRKVNVGTAHTMVQQVAFKFQQRDRQILDVYAEQLGALGTVQQMGHARIAAAKRLLVERLDGFDERRHGRRISAHFGFDPEVMLLRLLGVAVHEFHGGRVLE